MNRAKENQALLASTAAPYIVAAGAQIVTVDPDGDGRNVVGARKRVLGAGDAIAPEDVGGMQALLSHVAAGRVLQRQTSSSSGNGKRHEYLIAPGKTLSTFGGLRNAGDPILPSDVEGGRKRLDELVSQGYVVRGAGEESGPTAA